MRARQRLRVEEHFLPQQIRTPSVLILVLPPDALQRASHEAAPSTATPEVLCSCCRGNGEGCRSSCACKTPVWDDFFADAMFSGRGSSSPELSPLQPVASEAVREEVQSSRSRVCCAERQIDALDAAYYINEMRPDRLADAQRLSKGYQVAAAVSYSEGRSAINLQSLLLRWRRRHTPSLCPRLSSPQRGAPCPLTPLSKHGRLLPRRSCRC
jgi:hypothetical protein